MAQNQRPVTGGGRTPPRGQKPAAGSGLKDKPPTKNAKPKERQRQRNPFLSGQQNKLINQERSSDMILGNQAQEEFRDATDSFQQDIDWNQFQQVQAPNYDEIAPAFNPQDWNAWRQEQIDASAADFERQFGKSFAREKEDLEQTLVNRGIPMGSELYNQQMRELAERQDSQRQSNMVQAMNQAGSNASQFGNLAMQARGQGFGEQMQMYGQSVDERGRQMQDYFRQRNQPLVEGQLLRGAQSPLYGMDLQYGNQAALQQQQADAAQRLKYMGLQAGAAGGYRGTGLPYQDVLAMETAAQMQINQNHPGYQQPRQPSPWYQLGGAVLGTAAGIGMSYL